jgi:hypothetical protein
MFHNEIGIVSLLAVSFAFGGTQLGSGSLPRAVDDNMRGQRQFGIDDTESKATDVNRSKKADRDNIIRRDLKTMTLAFQLHGLQNSSVAMRLPIETFRIRSGPSGKIGEKPKLVIACEPVVSVLADVARRLEPGRCIV